jgi:hypothetical protein
MHQMQSMESLPVTRRGMHSNETFINQIIEEDYDHKKKPSSVIKS